MSAVPAELKFTKDHEWTKIEDGVATIGITDYAQGELGDIVFVELPAVGDTFEKAEVFGTIEAVKAVSDLYAPLSGEVVEINENLEATPENVNSDPYGDGWMIRIKLSNPDEVDGLLAASEYEELLP